ncbi:hypothetical protein [Thermococcus aciditolerans]|uniref:Uncharacterized protein n=1 Tax=Thermococcus aciditolerans TaxID=2598455 RepID=A0A5C0SHP5_9EURY|nr:hypothetical protein [Thermococcus aciditolerans]QEK13973.1 hypothetical protein FPV09_01260 [Thermococcus aciditolerans]
MDEIVENNPNLSKFYELLNSTFHREDGFSLNEDEEYIYLSGIVKLADGNIKEIKWKTNKKLLMALLDRINNLPKTSENLAETILYTGNLYEVPVKIAGKHLLTTKRVLSRIPQLNDPSNNIKYSVGLLSDLYLLFILLKLKEKRLFEYAVHEIRRKIRHELYWAFETRVDNEINDDDFKKRIMDIESKDILTLLKDNFPLPFRYTLKIEAEEDNRSIEYFEEIGDAFLFNLAYNLDIAIIKVTSFEELYRVQRFRRLRRSRTDELEPPRRRYIPDLVYHYQMAISADSPVLQFLSFYHILEHFFQRVYIDDLLKMIQDEITSPYFSYKRRKDLLRLYSNIKKRIESEHKNQSEHEALVLTLKKFVDIDEIKRLLEEYDPSLIDYYQNHKVEFSGGDKIDWTNEKDKILELIAQRIYATRNAIVHSKDMHKSSKGNIKKLPKYIPFKHDKELQKEIPLIRFIAEQIIIRSSHQL